MNAWILNNSVLNKKRIKEEIKGKLKCILRQTKMENSKTYGMQQSSLRGKFTAIHTYSKKQNLK